MANNGNNVKKLRLKVRQQWDLVWWLHYITGYRTGSQTSPIKRRMVSIQQTWNCWFLYLWIVTQVLPGTSHNILFLQITDLHKWYKNLVLCFDNYQSLIKSSFCYISQNFKKISHIRLMEEKRSKPREKLHCIPAGLSYCPLWFLLFTKDKFLKS